MMRNEARLIQGPPCTAPRAVAFSVSCTENGMATTYTGMPPITGGTDVQMYRCTLTHTPVLRHVWFILSPVQCNRNATH